MYPLRPARNGDICVLLEPIDQAEIDLLLRHQETLRKIFAGRPISPIHLTCQRFESQGYSTLQKMMRDLETALSDFQPIPITALSLVPMFSKFRQTNILKWQILLTKQLQRFCSTLGNLLIAAGVSSLYPPGWASDLVTALENINEINPDSHLSLIQYPHHLFTIRQVTFSKIKDQNRFNILEKITFKTQ